MYPLLRNLALSTQNIATYSQRVDCESSIEIFVGMSAKLLSVGKSLCSTNGFIHISLSLVAFFFFCKVLMYRILYVIKKILCAL